MNFDQVATDMSVEVYQQLKTAIEIGRWPDGKKLSDQQKQISLEAILRYEHQHLPADQRTGFLPPKNVATTQHTACSSADEEKTLRWQE